jgi:hypothetical protein
VDSAWALAGSLPLPVRCLSRSPAPPGEGKLHLSCKTWTLNLEKGLPSGVVELTNASIR